MEVDDFAGNMVVSFAGGFAVPDRLGLCVGVSSGVMLLNDDTHNTSTHCINRNAKMICEFISMFIFVLWKYTLERFESGIKL